MFKCLLTLFALSLAALPAAAKSGTAPAPTAKPSDGGRIFASPLARRIAGQKGLDLATLKGTGPHGRIVKADVEGAQPGQARAPATAPPSGQQSGPMTSFISHTTVDCRNAYELSEWWKQVLEYVDKPDDPNEQGHVECWIQRPDGGHPLLFIEVPEDKQVKNRVHFDLVPTDRTRDEEIDRVSALGATPLDDRRQSDGTGWLVLADPEGNEFCILRSDAERQPG